MQHFLFCFGIVIAIGPVAVAQEWNQFRGNDQRSGISLDTAIADHWPTQGPKNLWITSELGGGFSSVAISDGKVFTTGIVNRKCILFCLDVRSGERKWQFDCGKGWTKTHPGSRSTPTVKNNKVFLMTGHGKVFCIDAESGKERWSINTLKAFGDSIKVPLYGFSESLLVYDQTVICTPGRVGGAVVALGIDNGDVVWKAKTPRRLGGAAFCSPVLFDHRGQKMIATILEHGVIGLDPKTGKMLWSHAFANYANKGEHPNPLIYSDGYLLAATSGGGMQCFQLNKSGRSLRLKWTNKQLDPQMGAAVVVDGHIFSSSHRNSRSWGCIRLKDGQVKWLNKSIRKQGSVIAADGKLFLYSETGEVAVLKASAQKFHKLGSFKVNYGRLMKGMESMRGDGDPGPRKPHWAHPAIADQVLYIRYADSIGAFSLK